jgi:hypothetical protein
MIVTLSFKLMALFMLISNIFTYFEKYFPPVILRTFRFGKASSGIKSKPIFVEVPKGFVICAFLRNSTA